MKTPILSLTANDFEMQFFKASGPGGQNVNKRNSACRIIHKESGATGVARDQKEQFQNKKMAFKRLINSVEFKKWLNKRLHEITEKQTLEEKVDSMINNSTIKVETQKDGKWVDEL